MSTSVNLPKLRADLVAAAFPGSSRTKKSSTERGGELSGAYHSMKAKNPMYYNSLVDRHTTKYVQKPSVKKHLHQMGFTAVDGTVYPTRQEQIEANRVNHLFEEGQAMIRKVNAREQSRLRHLSKAARAGEITFTKDGVYETGLCEDCNVYHKVASHLNIKSPCPSSYFGRREAEQREKDANARRLLSRRLSQQRESISMQTSRVEQGHVFTQTSRKDGSNMTTQTSRRQLPHRATQTSRRILPDVGVQTSCVAQPVGVAKQFSGSSSVSRYESDNWSRSSTGFLSSAESYSSCDNCNTAGSEVINRLQKQNAVLKRRVHEQMLIQEKDALKERLQLDLNFGRKNSKTLTRLQVEVAKRTFIDRKNLDKCKSVFCTELKRKTALEAILKAITDEEERVNVSLEKEKAAERLREEQRKMDELIAEQIKLRMKRKLDEELEEKRQVLTATNIELADVVEAKRRAEIALVEKQEALITGYRQPEVSHPKRIRSSQLPRGRSSFRQISETSTQTEQPPRAGCPERDIAHAVTVLEQIKRDISNLFPQLGGVIQERIPTYTSTPRVPSRKSQVEKLPSVSNTYPLNLVATPVASETEVVKPKQSVSRRSSRISKSTLSTISQMWANAVEEVAAEQATMEVAPQTMQEPSSMFESASDAAVILRTPSRRSIASRGSSSRASMASEPSVYSPKESHHSLYSRPSSIECQSSEGLRADEGRVNTDVQQESRHSLYSRPSSIECQSSEGLRADEGRVNTDVQQESHHSLYSRPSSIECQSSEGLRADERRVADDQEESDRMVFSRPPSIECISSEALRIDEGRSPVAEQVLPSTSSIEGEPKSACNVSSEDEACKYISTSTLGVLSTRWSTLQESEPVSPPSEDSASKADEVAEATDNLECLSTSTLGCLSERWSALNEPSEDEARDEAVDTETSIVRVPTPPTYPKRSHLMRELVSSQSSLSQIKENSASDFSNEFVSPLAVYSHAMVPYQSTRTRLGLRRALDQTPSQDGPTEAELASSRAALVAEDEQIRRSLFDLVPPMRTIEEFYAVEAEANPMPPPSSPVSRRESTTQVQLNVVETPVESNIGIPKTETQASLKSEKVQEDEEPVESNVDSPKSETVSQQESTTQVQLNEVETPVESNAGIPKTETQASLKSVKVQEDKEPVESNVGIPRTETQASLKSEKEDTKDTPILDEYSATCLQETSSTYMFSAGSLTLAKINASVAKMKASFEAKSASEPEISQAVESIPKEDSTPIAAEAVTEPQASLPDAESEQVADESNGEPVTSSIVEPEVAVESVSEPVSSKPEQVADESAREPATSADESICEPAAEAEQVADESVSEPALCEVADESISEPAAETEPNADESVSEPALCEVADESISEPAAETESNADESVSEPAEPKTDESDSEPALEPETIESISTNDSTPVAVETVAEPQTSSNELPIAEPEPVADVSTSEPVTELPESSPTGSTASLKVAQATPVATEDSSIAPSASKVSTKSSKKGSTASLKVAQATPVATEDSSIAPSASKVSTKSSKKGSTASLKVAQATPVATEDSSIAPSASKVSTKSSKKGSTASLTPVKAATSKTSTKSSRRGSAASIKKLSASSVVVSTSTATPPDAVVEKNASMVSADVPASSQKGSTASLKVAQATPVATEDSSIAPSASKVSTKSSKKGSTASLKVAQATPVATEDSRIAPSASKVSTKSSKKGSSASLKVAQATPVATEDSRIAPSASKVSTKSSKKGSTASLKVAQATLVATEDSSIAPSASKVSTKSSKKGSTASLKVAQATPVATEDSSIAPSASKVSTKSSKQGSTSSRIIYDDQVPTTSSDTTGLWVEPDTSFPNKSSTSLKSWPTPAQSEHKMRVGRKRSTPSVKRPSMPLLAGQDVSSMTMGANNYVISSPLPERVPTPPKGNDWEVVIRKRSSRKSLTSSSKVSVKSTPEPIATPVKVLTPTPPQSPLPSTGSYADILKKKSDVIVPMRQSRHSITPSEVSIEPYMASGLTPKGSTMTLGEATTTIKSAKGSKKSLMSLRSSLKSLLLPSQMSNKMSRNMSQASTSGSAKSSPKVSTSSVRSI